MTNISQALAALVKAESFISGFEDDTSQEGVGEMLELIRSAVAAMSDDQPLDPISVSELDEEPEEPGALAYKVLIERHESFMIDVRADDEDDAREAAEYIFTHSENVGEFTSTSDWNISSVELT